MTDQDHLRTYFESYGAIRSFKLGKNKKTQESLGFAFVEYQDESVAMIVLSEKHYLENREVEKLYSD